MPRNTVYLAWQVSMDLTVQSKRLKWNGYARKREERHVCRRMQMQIYQESMIDRKTHVMDIWKCEADDRGRNGQNKVET